MKPPSLNQHKKTIEKEVVMPVALLLSFMIQRSFLLWRDREDFCFIVERFHRIFFKCPSPWYPSEDFKERNLDEIFSLDLMQNGPLWHFPAFCTCRSYNYTRQVDCLIEKSSCPLVISEASHITETCSTVQWKWKRSNFG